MSETTREPQYQRCLELRDLQGLSCFGLMSNQVWYDDPKRLVFLLSRYKFVAKMFSGMHHVLEIGCADAFGTRIVLQEVQHITAIDFDPIFIQDVQERMESKWEITCKVHDMLEGPVPGAFEGIYSLDVLEHIAQKDEHRFLINIVDSLAEHGVVIIGTPSIHSQKYASPPSKAGHINCKNYQDLKDLLSQFFHNVFIFSMNDEVVHTGFAPMAHYFLAMACSKQ